VLKRLQTDLQIGDLQQLLATDLRPTPKGAKLKGIIYEQADVRDAARLLELCKKYQPTVIIHLAAVLDTTSMPRAMQYAIDVEGTRNVLDAAVATNVQRIIVSSSGAAYGYHADHPSWLTEDLPLRGNEIFAYAYHKRLFRVGTILGKKTDNLITHLFHKKRILGLKGYASPFVFVWDEDVATCMQQAVFSKITGTYNLVGDGAITNQDLAKILNKPYRTFRPSVLRTLLSVLHPLRLAKYAPSQLLFLQYRPVLNNQKLKANFGFQPSKSSLETFCYYLETQGIEPQNLEAIQLLYPDKEPDI